VGNWGRLSSIFFLPFAFLWPFLPYKTSRKSCKILIILSAYPVHQVREKKKEGQPGWVEIGSGFRLSFSCLLLFSGLSYPIKHPVNPAKS